MRKGLVLFVLFVLSVASSYAWPAGAYFRTISVGKDNLIRIVWIYNEAEGDGFQVETIDSDGNSLALGPKSGPYGNWWFAGSATGPDNNCVVALVNRDQEQVALCQMDGGNNFAAVSFGTYVNPNKAAWPTILLDAIDSKNTAWFRLHVADASNPELWRTIMYPQGFAIASGDRIPRGSLSASNWYQNLTVRADDMIDFLGVGNSRSGADGYAFVYTTVPGVLGSYFNQLLTQAPIPTGGPSVGSVNWHPYMISATPDNHVLLNWTRWDNNGTHSAVWRIAPDGGFASSPEFFFPGWIPWGIDSSPFAGGDGRFRAVYHHSASGELVVATFDPYSWELTNVAYLGARPL